MNAPAGQRATSQPALSARAPALRRLTLIAAVLFVLVLADALYMQFSGYQAGTYNNFHLTDAATVFIAAGFLAVLTFVLAGLSRRAGQDRK